MAILSPLATPKRKGGRVYIDVNGKGEVAFHEGYLTRKEARRQGEGEGGGDARQQVAEREDALHLQFGEREGRRDILDAAAFLH